MTTNYTNLGVMTNQIIMKEKQLNDWKQKPESKRRTVVMEILTEEIEDLKQKIYALV